MYGKVGTSNVAAGIAVLPQTGNNRILFAAAISLLVAGVVILAVAAFAGRKNRVAAQS